MGTLVAPFIGKVENPIAIVGGDHHIHEHGQFNRHDERGVSSRISRSIKSLVEALKVGVERGAGTFIMNGDLMHDQNAIHPVVLSELLSVFEEHRENYAEIILNTGNHERSFRDDRFSTLTALARDPIEGMGGYHAVEVVVGKTRVFNSNSDYVLIVVPFYYDSSRITAEVDAAIQSSREHQQRMASLLGKTYVEPKFVLLGHYPLLGADVGSGTPLDTGYTFEMFRPDLCELLIFSDIHKRQLIGANGIHLGATHSNNFGDGKNPCGWWLLGTTNGKVMLEPLPSYVDEFITVDDEVQAEHAHAAGCNLVRLALDRKVETTRELYEAPRAKSFELDELIESYIESQSFKDNTAADLRADLNKYIVGEA